MSCTKHVRASYNLGFPEDGPFAASLGLARGDMLPVILISFVFNLAAEAKDFVKRESPFRRSWCLSSAAATHHRRVNPEGFP
jgi:hypothetical protein